VPASLEKTKKELADQIEKRKALEAKVGLILEYLVSAKIRKAHGPMGR